MRHNTLSLRHTLRRERIRSMRTTTFSPGGARGHHSSVNDSEGRRKLIRRVSDANDLQSSGCGTHSRTQTHKVTGSVSVRRGRPLEAERGANTFNKIPLARESGPEPLRGCGGIKEVRFHQLCAGECGPIKGAQGVQHQWRAALRHQGRAA